ncbi:MAG TPA: sigma-70 family RNA polymerase sigma factor [Solirubrobacteraceae bacterium]|jgi:RNA polymerase primary sigma factor
MATKSPCRESVDASASRFGDIGRVNLLTREQETALAQRIERGDFDAKTHMVEANLRLVASFVHLYKGQGTPEQDLFQEGVLGLIRAVEKFDYRRGIKFSTYASLWIRQAMQRALQDRGRLIHLPANVSRRLTSISRVRRELTGQLGREPTNDEIAVELRISTEDCETLLRYTKEVASLHAPIPGAEDIHLAEVIPDSAPTAAERSEQSAMQRSVHAALPALDGLSRQVVELRYGIGDRGGPFTVTETAQRLHRKQNEIRTLERNALTLLGAQEHISAWRPVKQAA